MNNVLIEILIARRVRFKNRMQMIIPPTKLRQHQRVLREIEGISVKLSPAVLDNVLGKSSAILVCLSESCLSHDVTRALRHLGVCARQGQKSDRINLDR